MQYKFRVWDPITKSYGGGNLWHIASDGTLHYGNAEWPEGVVEMWTGLCDKNGVEVHEGDICRHGYSNIYGDFYNNLTVEYFAKDSCFGLYDPKTTGYKRITEHMVKERNIEVIGNIHEGVKE